MWLSDFLGYPINGLGDAPAVMNDVLVDLGSSRVKYVILDFGTLGDPNAVYVVPFTALDTTTPADGDMMAFNSTIDRDTLAGAPIYDPGLYPDATIMPDEFVTDTDAFWSQLGFDVNQ